VKKKWILVLFLFLSILFKVVSQELNEKKAYEISSVVFDLSGRTNEALLRKKADILIGSRYISIDELDKFLADRMQVLKNERVLESVSITYELVDKPDHIEVLVTVKAKDTWNIVVLPYFRYDTNSGLLVSARARDYNFLGSMQAFVFNANVLVDEHGEVFPSLETSFKLPFKIGKLDWAWLVDSNYILLNSGDPDFDLSTGLSVSKEFGPGSINSQFLQSGYINNRNSDGSAYTDDLYLMTSAESWYSWVIADIPSFGSIGLIPRMSLVNRWIPGADLTDSSLDVGVELTPSLLLSVGRVDWKGNLRKGFSASIKASYSYYPQLDKVVRIFNGASVFHTIIGESGPSARLGGYYRPDDTDSSAGRFLRGILDKRIDTGSFLYANLDIPVRIIDFTPSEWNWPKWMRYFDFEQYWGPFLDVALVENMQSGMLFDPSDSWIGAGLEVVTFPRITRSLYVRISLGLDLRSAIELGSLAVNGTSSRDGKSIFEVFFGLGHFY